MNPPERRAIFAAAASVLFLATGLGVQNPPPRRGDSSIPCESKIGAACDQLDEGIKSFRDARIQAAILHFSNAVAIDPTLLVARLYLGTAYAQQYIPGAESPENVNLGKRAIEVFEEVLKRDADNVTALASIAQLYYNLKEFEKAKDYQRRRIKTNPEDPEPYFWVGVTDWAICYPPRMQLRKDLNIIHPPDPDKPGSLTPLPEGARAELAQTNLALIEEGIEALERALELKPDDPDAMAYLNLLYRERADLQADEGARQADLETADTWVGKALQTMKKRHQATPPTVIPE